MPQPPVIHHPTTPGCAIVAHATRRPDPVGLSDPWVRGSLVTSALWLAAITLAIIITH